MVELKKVGVIEVYEVPEEIRRLSRKEKIAKINEYFKKELQGKTVTYEILGEEREVGVNARTRQHYYSVGNVESKKSYFVRLGIGANGEIGRMIGDVKYKKTNEERKRNQNSVHRHVGQWHYFTKPIQCDGDFYEVIVNVREMLDGKLYLHTVELTELKQTKGINLATSNEAVSCHEDNLGIDSFVENTIPQKEKKVNGSAQEYPDEDAVVRRRGR